MYEKEGLAVTALAVARCAELVAARATPTHPCHRIVTSQPADDAQFQVPEGWAGNLASGRIVFLSSNPSISEAGDHQSGESPERYPTADWSDEAIVDFVTHRFDAPHRWATPDGHFRRTDGTLSPRPVPFWTRVRNRASELLGRPADPTSDYAIVDLVHCKSKKEAGVALAAPRCHERHLDRILSLSPAPLVVVLGGKARDQVRTVWELPAAFGTQHAAEWAERDNLAAATIAGRERLVAFLWHPTGMTLPQKFADAFPRYHAWIRDVVAGRNDPSQIPELA